MDQQPSPTELGRALAALRRRVVQICPVCKRSYEGAAHKRYCSAACRQQAYRERLEAKEGNQR